MEFMVSRTDLQDGLTLVVLAILFIHIIVPLMFFLTLYWIGKLPDYLDWLEKRVKEHR